MKTNKPCYKWASNSTRGLDRLSKHCNFKSVSYNVRNEKKSIGTTHDTKECRIRLRLVGMRKDNLARNSFRKWNCCCDWLKLGKEYHALNLSLREKCLYFLFHEIFSWKTNVKSWECDNIIFYLVLLVPSRPPAPTSASQQFPCPFEFL